MRPVKCVNWSGVSLRNNGPVGKWARPQGCPFIHRVSPQSAINSVSGTTSCASFSLARDSALK